MVRKEFLLRTVLSVSLIAEIYLIAYLLVKEKSWGLLAAGAAGFAGLPITGTVYVKTSAMQPATKVVVITAIWAVWVVLAAIAGLTTYIYWYNFSPNYSGLNGGGRIIPL